ncbi:MAG: prepilin-type N-terminal cleavage/methylation domain-containing protein [bacterium]|nr:prepilin-type N-terminal cleavage/methylation domain-containing protein [bacterium]
MKKNTRKKLEGLTLIEMMMSIAIFTMGIAGFTLLFSKTWQTNSYVLQMGQSSMTASQGVNKMVDYIRRATQAEDGSYPIKTADADSLTIYSDYDKDNTVERLHFYKSGQNILLGVTDPAEIFPRNYASGDQQIITLVSNVVNGNDEPFFYYYNKDYPGDDINNPLVAPVSSHLAEIRLMKIYLEVNTRPSSTANDVKIQSFVELRNLNDYDRVQ